MDKDNTKLEQSSLGQLVSFALGDEIYGLDVMLTESIERVSDITRVPKTPNYVLGITNIRGEIVPIVSLRKRLGMKDREYDDDTRIIICRWQDYRIGILVDKVYDVFTASQSVVQAGNHIFKDQSKDFISMVIEYNKDYLLVLDLLKVLNIGEGS